MIPTVALCADTESIRRPNLIGLVGENLARQEWLRLFSTGEETRRFLRADKSVVEAWVAGCDDVEPINLAAALKRDRADLRVCLLTFQGTGSLMSRAMAAGVDASLTRQAFIERYTTEKHRHGLANRAAAGVGAGIGGTGTRAAIGGAGTEANVDSSRATARPALSAVARTGSQKSIGSFYAAPQVTKAVPTKAEMEENAASPRTEARCESLAAPAAHVSVAEHPAFLLPVVSGSGGAGKSTVAVLSALFSQGLGYRTLLLDFDLRFGNVHEMLGVSEALSVDEALVSPARLAALAPSELVPAVLAAPKRLEEAEAVVSDAPKLLGDLQNRFDVIVVNTGASWAEEHALLLERCSKALFLVDQRPSSLRACRHALELCSRCGIATGPFLFAANRCAKGAPLTSIDVSCALRGAPAVELRDGGGEVEELLGAGQPLDLIAAKNDLCTSLEHLLVDLLPGCGGRAPSPIDLSRAHKERWFGRSRRRVRRRDVPCLC